MKIKSVAAVGAMGVGLGVASFIGGTGTASAGPAECDALPIGGGKLACLTNDQVGTFLQTTSPGYNIDVLLNGNEDDPDLGLLDQPTTFANSIGDFLNGPTNPDPAAAPDDTPPGSS